MDLLCDPAIVHIIYPRKINIYFHGGIYTQMYIADSFMWAQKWKLPRYLSKDEWFNKLWYIHIMEYYTAIKGNEWLYEKIWIPPKKIMLSEKGKSQKGLYCKTPPL